MVRQRRVFNLQFGSGCNEYVIQGYRFHRLADYEQSVKKLEHRFTLHSEFTILPHCGQHAVTAVVDLPDQELPPVLPWKSPASTALSDIALLLSLFKGRSIAVLGEDATDECWPMADPRIAPWGGLLRCSLPTNLADALSDLYASMRSPTWRETYDNGYYLLLGRYAFGQDLREIAFLQCWTIWEHLYAVLHRKHYSSEEIERTPAKAKIGFLLSRFGLVDDLNEHQEKVRELTKLRNRLVHNGRFPNEMSDPEGVAELFIRLTETVVAKTLDLQPSTVLNTRERLDRFLKGQHLDPS